MMYIRYTMEVTLLQPSPPENTRDSTRVLISQVTFNVFDKAHVLQSVSGFYPSESCVLIHIADT